MAARLTHHVRPIPDTGVGRTWAEALQVFEDAQRADGYAPDTIAARVRRMRAFCLLLDVGPWDLTAAAYREHVERTTRSKPALDAHRSFYVWAFRSGRIPHDPTVKPANPIPYRPIMAGTVEAFGPHSFDLDRDGSDSVSGYSNRMVAELIVAELRAGGRSSGTVEERLILLNTFARWLGPRRPIATAQRSDLIAFLGQGIWAPATLATYRSTLRTTYNLLQDEGVRIDNPSSRLPKVRVVQPEVNPLSTQQIEQLLATCRNSKTRLMVLLAAYQGFRVAEVAAVHGRNIDWTEQLILTIEAKGGKEVWRPIHSLVWREIQRFPRDGYFFPNFVPNKRGAAGESHVLSNSVSRLLGDALYRAGIKGHRPHQLRAWYATELLGTGADTMTVAFAMRHSGPQTLSRYVKPSQARIREAMEALPRVRVPESS